MALQLCNAHNTISFSTNTLNFHSSETYHRSLSNSMCKGLSRVSMCKDSSQSDDLSLRLTQSLNSWKGDRFSDSNTKQGNGGSIQSQVVKKQATERPLQKKETNIFNSKIRLQSTRAGKGGKTVTMLKGLEHLPKEEVQQLLRTIKHKLSVGGKIGETGILEIQGDQVSILLEYLISAGYKDVKKG